MGEFLEVVVAIGGDGSEKTSCLADDGSCL